MSLVRSEARSVWPLDRVWSEDRIERAFRDLFRGFFSGEGMLDKVPGSGPGLMRVEEIVEDEALVIRAEMPGIDPERDVEISVSDGFLHIHAEREERTEEKRQNGYRTEFRYGTFERSLELPEGTVESDITAGYKDGILEVRVPAPPVLEGAAPEPVKIPVQKG